MKNLLVLVITSLGAALVLHGSSAAQQVGGGQLVPTKVVCDGAACGGASSFPYRYQVKPGTNASISYLEVGVEDGNVDHYSLLAGPSEWQLSIVTSARFHEVPPTEHGQTTSKIGTCPYVLKFSGPAQSANFDLAYSYSAGGQVHDVGWKASDGKQSSWSSPVGTNAGPVHSPIRPNILLIVLDDVGTDKLTRFDDPSHTHSQALTPRLDQLAEEGIQFNSYYVNPVCSTTRACLQTGRYSFRHGVGALAGAFALNDAEVTIAELLKAGFPAGLAYTSGAFGKWHLAPLDPDHACKNGYDRFYGTLANTLTCQVAGAGANYDWGKVEDNSPPQAAVPVCVTCDNPPASCASDGCTPPSDYNDHQYCAPALWSADVVRRDAATWINAQSSPFFAYVAFNPPHYPLQTPPGKTEDGRDLLSPTTLGELTAGGFVPGSGGGTDPARQQFVYRTMLEAVDSEIKYLIDDIDASKRDRTMIFVVSDNGTEPEMIESPHPQRGKDSVYQLGVRVAMVVSGPLVPTPPANGWVCDELVGAVDLWRTIRDVTGADEELAFHDLGVSPAMDSISFLPLIQDPTASGTRTVAFSQLFTPSGNPIDCVSNHARAITDGVFRYIRKQVPIGRPPCDDPENPSRTYTEEFYLVSDHDEQDQLLDASGLPPEGMEGYFVSLRNAMLALSGD